MASQIWLSVITVNSYKLCIQSVISGGFPYYYTLVGSEVIKGWSIVSNNSPGGCQSLQSRKRLISHVLFSMPISRGTVITVEVEHLLDFLNIKTDLELCLVT